jgi:hypothetical protein
MTDRKRQPVIEFVGVPGAGKSTLVRRLREVFPAMLGPQLPPASRRAGAALYAAAAALFLSIRPLFAYDLNRCFKIIEAHNIYREGLSAPLLLEQGLLQRVWAVIADRRIGSPQRLESFMRLLAEAPPDVIVRINTPPVIAAQRILARRRGNSRYEHMAEADIAARLGPAEAVYDILLAAFRDHSRVAILDVSGEDPIAENVPRIADFVLNALPGLDTARASLDRCQRTG